jgi:hypothetical protein
MEVEISVLLPVIKARAEDAFRNVLGIDCSAEEPWTVVGRVENPSDFGATVGFANELWQGACTVGISTESASRLLPDLSEDLLFDALGEVGNTVCGLLSSDPEFTGQYGILEQTPPLFSRGGAWLARSPGVQGNFAANGGRILFGCTVRTSGPRRAQH